MTWWPRWSVWGWCRLTIDSITHWWGLLGMTSITSPVRSWLSIHGPLGVLWVAMRHVLLRVWRVLAVRVGWTRGCDWRIYRHILVRFHSGMMMVRWTILQRHGRTCWLSHCATTAYTLVTCRMMILAMYLIWKRSGTRRNWLDTVLGGWGVRRRVYVGTNFLLWRI